MIAHLASLTTCLLPLAEVAQSDAFRVGYVIGLVLAFAAMLAVAIFGIVAIVLAFTKRTGGWIVVGCIGGAALLGLAFLFTTGFVRGFQRGYDNARARRVEGGAPALAPVRITGQVLPFTVEQPAGWHLLRKQMAYDVVLSLAEDYVGLIVEEADLGNSTKIAELARQRIGSAGSDVTCGDDESITIDGRTWVAFTVKCKVQDIPFAYQYYVYTGKEGTFQIMGWTFQNLWDRDVTKIRTVMQSFRFPPASAAAP